MPQRHPIVTDQVTQRRRIRCYDVRKASEQYSNIAGLLAGFAFTVLMLVAQSNAPSLSEVETLRRNFAAIGFFVVFFGAILSSFVFAVISGEEALTPRANQMAFFGGASFSLTLALSFWSIAEVLRGFLVEEVAILANQILPIFLVIHPLYVTASVLDNIFMFERRDPVLAEYLITTGPSIAPIVVAGLIRLTGGGINLASHTSPFYAVIWFFLLMIVIGNCVSALFSTVSEDFRLNILFSGIWMSLNTTLIGLLMLMK